MPESALIAVDPNLETAPYQQIFEQIRAAIERGDLGVAPNTVARAYADLQQAGWLVSEGRRGTRVAAKTPAGDRRARLHALTDAVAHFVETLRHRGYTKEEIDNALGSTRRA